MSAAAAPVHPPAVSAALAVVRELGFPATVTCALLYALVFRAPVPMPELEQIQKETAAVRAELGELRSAQSEFLQKLAVLLDRMERPR